MRKCMCTTCKERFNSLKDKLIHKKKYPNKSCLNKKCKEVEKMWGKKKKKKEVEAPVEAQEEVPDLSVPEPVEEVVKEEVKEVVKEEVKEKPQDDELTEEVAKEVLTNHEARLKRIEYHLRI